MREALLAAALVAIFVLKAEYPDWGRRLASVLVHWASWGLPDPDRSIRRARWEAELASVQNTTDRSCTGLTYAVWVAARHGWRIPLRVAAVLPHWLCRREEGERRPHLGVDFMGITDAGTVWVAQVKTPMAPEDWQDGFLVP